MKGMSLSPDAILYLVLAVITAIIMLIFVASIGGTDFVDEAPCTGLSMFSSIQQRLDGIKVFEAKSSRADRKDLCPPMDVTIAQRTSDEEAIEAIAHQLALCHRNYGAGDLDLFQQDRNSKVLYCVLCSRIELEGSGELEGFTEYLETTRLPGKEHTYLEYLGGFEDDPLSMITIPEITITRGQTYGAFYLYGKQQDFFKSSFEAGTVGVAAGGVLGAVIFGAAAGAILGPPGSLVGAVVAGSIVVTSAVIGSKFGAGLGGVGAVKYLPSGNEYVGATVLVPWDEAFFADTLKCDQVR